MTPLRQRMIQDLQLRNLSKHTQEAYVRAIAKLAQHYGRSPDQLSQEEVRAYLVHLVQKEQVAKAVEFARFLFENAIPVDLSNVGKYRIPYRNTPRDVSAIPP